MSENVTSRITNHEGPTEAAVAVVGIGTMGSAFARRLHQMGVRVTAWNRGAKAREALAAKGIEVFDDPRRAVGDVGVVISMLPTADVTDAVMVDGGVVDAMAPGAVWTQRGTIGVSGYREAGVHGRCPSF